MQIETKKVSYMIRCENIILKSEAKRHEGKNEDVAEMNHEERGATTFNKKLIAFS
jgi:hypothetical protein